MYEALGEPCSFASRSAFAGLRVMQFLVLREHRAPGDARLTRLADGLLAGLVAYLLLAGVMAVHLVRAMPPGGA